MNVKFQIRQNAPTQVGSCQLCNMNLKQLHLKLFYSATSSQSIKYSIIVHIH
jgi:hypothetical protein